MHDRFRFVKEVNDAKVVRFDIAARVGVGVFYVTKKQCRIARDHQLPSFKRFKRAPRMVQGSTETRVRLRSNTSENEFSTPPLAYQGTEFLDATVT